MPRITKEDEKKIMPLIVSLSKEINSHEEHKAALQFLLFSVIELIRKTNGISLVEAAGVLNICESYLFNQFNPKTDKSRDTASFIPGYIS